MISGSKFIDQITFYQQIIKMDSIQRKQISIDPTYLIQISHSIQILSHFYEQQSLGNLSAEYRNLLTSSFTSLNQSLQLYTSTNNAVDSSMMVNAALIKCKSQIEMYCLEKLAFLLKKETELGDIVYHIIKLCRQNMDDFQKLLLEERRKRIDNIEGEKDKIIAKLKEELLYRKEYIAQLKQRLDDVEQENSKIHQKIIGNAKLVADRALSPSPKKINSSTLSPSLGTTKLKIDALLGTAHKTLSAKQVEETILDIMETKQKQETVKGKKVSLKYFLKTYFRFKFGMKDLADETELNFKQAVEFFSQSQEKNIFILFLKILNEQCEEQYFWQQKTFNEKLIRVIKRYLNEKDNIPIDELERIYDAKIMDERSDVRLNRKDVQYILINTYKTSEVDSLQMILNQILIPKLQKNEQMAFSAEQLMIPSKMLINEILNYQLSRHLLKIEDVIRVIRDVDKQRGYLNQEQLETVIARLKIDQDRIQACYDVLMGYEGKFVTYSEAIEVIEKMRKVKTKKVGDRTR